MTHQLTPQKKKDTFGKVEKSRKVRMKKSTHLLPPQKRRLTQSTKHRNVKNPQKQLLPSKIRKMIRLKKQINQDLFQ